MHLEKEFHQKMTIWKQISVQINLKKILNNYSKMTGQRCLIRAASDNGRTRVVATATPAEGGDRTGAEPEKVYPIMAGQLHLGDFVCTGTNTLSEQTGTDTEAMLLQLIELIATIASQEMYIYQEQQKCETVLTQHRTIEERYQMMLNNISEGVLIYDARQKIIAANDKAYQIYHIPKGQLIGAMPQDYNLRIVDENMQPLSCDEFPTRQLFETGKSIRDKILGYQLPDREDIVWVRLNGAAISCTGTRVNEVIVTFEDISLQKQKMDAIVETMRDMEKNQQMVQLGAYSSNIKEGKWVSSLMHQHILGIEHAQIKAHTDWIDVLHPDWKKQVVEAFVHFREQKNDSYNFIYKIVKPNTGEERWIRDIGRILYDEQGMAEMALGTIQDITELKLAEEQARQNEEKYRRIFENVQDVYYKISHNYNILEVSPSLRFMTSTPASELIGVDATAFLSDRSKLDIMDEIIRKEGGLKDFHLTLRDKHGHLLPVSLSAHVLRDAEGNIVSYEGFVRDISYRKKIESLLKQSESKLRSYIECAPTLIAITDTDRNIIETNPACGKLTGYSPEDISQLHFEDLFAPQSMDLLEPHLLRILTEGSSSNEFALKCKNGDIRTLQIDSTLLPDGKIISFGIDISYRKKLAESLIQHKETLEEAQRLAKVGNATIDLETGLWQSSENFDKLIGITDTFEKRNTNWKQLIHPDDLNAIRSHFQHKLDPKHPSIKRELRIIRLNDHKTIWIKAIGQIAFTASGRPGAVRFSMQDISEQKFHLEMLKTRETLYRTTLNASPDVILVVDTNNCIKIISNAALKLFGYDHLQEMLGQKILRYVAPDDMARARKDLTLAYQFNIGTKELKMLKRNGETFIGEVSGDILRNEQLQPTGLVLILRDITERKRVEQKLIESEKQLKNIGLRLQQVREEEKTALAREIHDDMGQIMVAMKIDLGLLKNKLLRENPRPQTLASEIDSILELTNKTIEAARRIMDELRTDELQTLGFIATATKMIEQFENRNFIPVEFFYPQTVLHLDRNQSITLYRILQESLSNITKYAHASEVCIHISTQNNQLEMTITDDGCGFDLRQHQRSNAYGLRGMQERILLLEGEISIQSQPNQGTTISIRIPYPAESGK